MKRALILTVLVLSGCAINKFDSTEYMQATRVYTDATFYASDCNSPTKSALNATSLYHETSTFANYADGLANKNVAASAKILNTNVKELADHYSSGKPVNPFYCKLKYQIIESEAKLMQHVLGGNPK